MYEAYNTSMVILYLCALNQVSYDKETFWSSWYKSVFRFNVTRGTEFPVYHLH